MIYDIGFNVVAMDDDNTVLDIVDGEFETIERARKQLAQIIERDNEDNRLEDRSIFKIQKITRELVE